MKVRDLIRLLEEQDPNATVLVMSQESWPFECSLSGVVGRQELVDEEEPDEDRKSPAPPEGAAMTDVFLVEGRQLRYGSRSAWRR